MPASYTDGISLRKMLISLIYLSPQKQACMLIRNLVSRSRDFSQPILDMGAENLITEARATHRDCDDVAKAALRDLGCKVELRELWTGQKGSLAQWISTPLSHGASRHLCTWNLRGENKVAWINLQLHWTGISEANAWLVRLQWTFYWELQLQWLYAFTGGKSTLV